MHSYIALCLTDSVVTILKVTVTVRPVQHMTLDYGCSQASFEAAQLPPVHQTKPAMKALKVLPG